MRITKADSKSTVFRFSLDCFSFFLRCVLGTYRAPPADQVVGNSALGQETQEGLLPPLSEAGSHWPRE